MFHMSRLIWIWQVLPCTLFILHLLIDITYPLLYLVHILCKCAITKDIEHVQYSILCSLHHMRMLIDGSDIF